MVIFLREIGMIPRGFMMNVFLALPMWMKAKLECRRGREWST